MERLVNENEVLNMMKDLKLRQALRPDGDTGRLFREYADQWARLIYSI